MKRLIILLISVALAACSTPATPSPTEAPPTNEPRSVDPTTQPTEAPPTTEPTATTAPTNTPTTLPEGYATYTNEDVGFQIGYPDDWFVDLATETTTYLTSFNMDDAPATEGIPAGETKIDIILRTDSPPSPADFADEQREDSAAIGEEVTNVEELTVLNGTEAVIITTEGDRGTGTTFYTRYNNTGIIISPFGETGPFRTMLGTLQPAP